MAIPFRNVLIIKRSAREHQIRTDKDNLFVATMSSGSNSPKSKHTDCKAKDEHGKNVQEKKTIPILHPVQTIAAAR